MRSSFQILHTFLSILMLLIFIACNPIEQKTAQLTSMIPVISNINARSGTTFGGDQVTITGENFLQGATVRLGTSNCNGANVIGTTSITCTTSAHAAAIVGVTVLNPNGREATLNSAFTYTTSQTVTSVYPDYGASSGGTAVTITGTGFTSSSSVDFGGASCTSVVFVNSTTLTCVTPAHVVGSSRIRVTNAASVRFESTSNLFTFRAPPTISSVSLNAGAIAGGTNITITGSGFYSSPTVTVGGAACTSIVVISGSIITCTTPAHAAGTVDVIVTNTDTQTVTSTNAFTYQAAPTLTSITPNGGLTTGGTTITLTGTGFAARINVDLGGSACKNVNVINSTTLTCITSNHAAGAITATVTNVDNQSGQLALAYTYRSAPTITSVSPNGGLPAGGTNITITGTGFVTGATVTIGGFACTAPLVTVVPTTITCTTPANPAGTYDIVVTNPDTQSGTARLLYTYRAAPTVAAVGACPGSAVCPLTGALAGGALVTVTGTGFVTGATVLLGVLPCTPLTVVNSTTITCVTPSNIAGAVAVRVTNTDTQFANTAAAYDYVLAPTLTSAAPTGGPPAGGTPITISGSNFITGATVTIGGSECTGLIVVNSTTITCTTPAKTAGTYAAIITNPDGQTGINNSFYTYRAAPTVSSLSVSGGVETGLNTITIYGTGFYTGAIASVGGINCGVTTVVSANQLTCTVPAPVPAVVPPATSTVDVRVTNLDTQFGTKVASYTYRAAPTVAAVGACPGSAVCPLTGALAGGISVTITGTGFVAGATVTLGGSTCSNVNVTSATSLTCTNPAHASGAVTVTVTNPDTQSGSRASAFTYLPAPSVTSALNSNSLNRGSSLGGTTPITITGTNISAGATVTIGGTPCAVILVTAPTTITCTLGVHAAGTVDVVVTNSDGQTGTLTNGFIYQIAPTLSYVTLNYGGTVLTINAVGTGLDPGVKVSLDSADANCTGESFIDSTTVQCAPQAHAPGPVNVLLTNSDGQVSNTLTTGYIYVGAPTVTSVAPTSGPIAGGTSITVTGTNFINGASVTIAGISCASVNVTSSTNLTCTTGAYTPTTAHVSSAISVTNPDSQNGSGSTFDYYTTPQILSLLPTPTKTNKYIATGGTGTLTISSSNNTFIVPTTVTINGTACAVTGESTSSIVCTTAIASATTGLATVVVTNSDGQSSTYDNSNTKLYYIDQPTLTNVSPVIASTSGGTIITLTGTNFISESEVTIDGATCPIVTQTSTQITCTAPAHASAAALDVHVNNPDGFSVGQLGSFTYADPPTISGISPNNGGVQGGTYVTITGTNFSGTPTVTIGGSPCSGVANVTATSLTCTTPSGTGSQSITVTNPNALTVTGSSFTYTSNAKLEWTSSLTSVDSSLGNYGITATNKTITFSLKNTGNLVVSALSIYPSGGDAGAFTVGTSTCGSTLGAGATCTIQIIFFGGFLTTGPYTSSLIATGNSGGTTTSTVLTGAAP